jgi:hypothetical protein
MSHSQTALSTNEYTVSGINSLYVTAPLRISDSACLAASRAILRHRVSIDHNHLSVRSQGGLHPMYLALHGDGRASGADRNDIKRLLDETRNDIFDAVSGTFPTFFSILNGFR